MNNEKIHFVLKLIPPRPSFSIDMSEEERTIMQQHVSYWSTLMDRGIVIAYGPVMDPNGVYGLGIIEVDNEEQVREITTNDPAASINRYEYYPMRAIIPVK